MSAIGEQRIDAAWNNLSRSTTILCFGLMLRAACDDPLKLVRVIFIGGSFA